MKASYWGYLLIGLGLFILLVMFFVYNYSTADESDYYLLKEATEAAMIDSVDRGVYFYNAEVVIEKEKFVENFIRRFSEITNINRSYKIEFFEIIEDPPKVSVRVTTSTGEHTFNSDTADNPVINRIDGILETRKQADPIEGPVPE